MTIAIVPRVPSRPSPTNEDIVPPELAAVIDLFARELAGVSFPDVGSAELERLAEAVREQGGALDAARLALAAAEELLAERTAALAAASARGLAYARIYAEAHPERSDLGAALTRLARPAPTREVEPKKRRGRPPKVRGEDLFAEPSAAISGE